ncbi:hypothetical protein ACUHMQ_11990 [Chitinimonas sp. PSY-7]|uniref:hypothetical protein n=1 Tax=Chitinimonas sp. PSY-7 TaxID=3459088 RepID=UPI00403FDC10
MPIADATDWFAGLRALNQSCFPKRCANCGHVYESADDYCRLTQAIQSDKSGLKAVNDEIDGVFVELYRNCICGSTLMEFFGERRNQTEPSLKRREIFSELHNYLVQSGIPKAAARAELLRVMHGERSEQLEAWYAEVAVRTNKT